MRQFFNKAAKQNHPLRVLADFLRQEKASEDAKRYSDMRFVGYVLDIGYDTVTIITSDPFKVAVGGVPRNSLLVMVPAALEDIDDLPLHFTLLRVLESAPTPLSKEVQQTYFELQKKSMPELDVFTSSELQWGALKTGVLGMFYEHPETPNAVEFSGDLNNFVSAHKYRVLAPGDELLDLIVNSIVPPQNRFEIGKLRLTECRLPLPDKAQPNVTVRVSTRDFMASRTAMFGKTRLGKSNVVKLIAQSLIETTAQTCNAGQLIFDINGEYANDNPQDGSRSLKSGYPNRCEVYALTPKAATPSKPLKLNFYEQPDSAHKIIGSLLTQQGVSSGYVRSFSSVELPSLDEVTAMPPGSDKIKSLRKLQIFMAILAKAGYQVDEIKLKSVLPSASKHTYKLNPGFNQELRAAAFKGGAPDHPDSLAALVNELEIINRFRRDNADHAALKSKSTGEDSAPKAIFDALDVALFEFFDPSSGRSGTSFILPFRKYHDDQAGDFVKEILRLLDKGQTVILDLGNANEEVMKYFSNELSTAVFNHQVEKFTNDNLGDHFIQLYFEEAHNLFPRDEDPTTIYSRFAKEGAKYHIGMLYSTQSVTTINRDLLAQTENFFIAHLSSQDEVNALAKVNVAYESLKNDILQAKTPGYIRMLTRSHRFVVSVQAHKFTVGS